MSDSVVYFQRAQFGQILMAIDNIAEKCHRHMDPDFDEMNLDDKLQIIKVRPCHTRRLMQPVYQQFRIPKLILMGATVSYQICRDFFHCDWCGTRIGLCDYC